MMLHRYRAVTILSILSFGMLAGVQSEIIASSSLRRKRSSNDANPSTDTNCERFSEPLSNNTFFSPIDTAMLNNNYPPRTDCILIIVAPSGSIIKLDFRNRFAIEPSPLCENDYLEIRDGKYGFSSNKKPFGRYCGRDFPEEIFSTENYLWLRFHSDDNIEYEGFEGVYEFREHPKKTETLNECTFEQTNEIQGTVSNNDINQTYVAKLKESQSSLDCLWMIEVKPGWQIMLSFEKFDLEKKNDCESNFVDIIGENTNVSEPKKHFCGVMAEAFESKSNRLHVRFFATGAGLDSTFELSYTAYTKKRPLDGKNATPSCSADEFDCDDDTCIDIQLKCDNHNNCKFKKDENGCDPNEGKPKDLWLIIAVFSALLGAMTSVFLFNCIRTLIRDQKIIRETIRQSKESKLDEAGRMSIKRSLENVNRIIPGATGYTIEATMKKVQDEDTEHMYRGTASVSSVSDAGNKINKPKYNYRNELKKILRNPPNDSVNNNSNERLAQYSNDGVCEIACQTRQSLLNADSCSNLHPFDGKSSTIAQTYHSRDHHPFENECEIKGATNRFYRLPEISNTFNRNEIPSSMNVGIYNRENTDEQCSSSPASSSNTEKLRIYENSSRDMVNMEHSQLMLEIRNSAPDVIIMTSQ